MSQRMTGQAIPIGMDRYFLPEKKRSKDRIFPMDYLKIIGYLLADVHG